MIKDSMKKLKRNQYDSQSGLFSDCFNNGTERLFYLLHLLYTSIIRHGFYCDLLTTTTIHPIPKNKKKSMSDSENYRAIAPNGVFIKLLDYIILDFFSDIFLTSDQQFAYKSEFSTTLCTYMAIETIQYYLKSGSAV